MTPNILDNPIVAGTDADLLAKLIESSDQVLIKRLSNNDRDWARMPDKHQNGVYIPHEERDGGFFPSLHPKARVDPTKPEIRERFVTTTWQQVGGLEKKSRLVHYTSKGQETHLTRLPSEAFARLAPASFLVMGRIRSGDVVGYACLTIDSSSDECSLLRSHFELESDFAIGTFRPDEIQDRNRELFLDFADRVISAWFNGRIAEFARSYATMPSPIELAQKARDKFLLREGLGGLNPFSMSAPGDALREISRDIEWNLFREFQRRERSVELIRSILGDTRRSVSSRWLMRQFIERYWMIDALMLSASNQRRSRAGSSYELHIEAMLTGGCIPFEKQVMVESRKRPDFVLPSLNFLDSARSTETSGFILSAKTTLRERWKQVEREKGDRALYLATVDDSIASTAIKDMASFGVQLVVPESLMNAKETEYAGHPNVMSFKNFCEEIIRPRLNSWA